MVMNLKKLRESEFTKRGLELIKKSNKTYKFFDQDILNYFYNNNFFRLDPRWNTQLYIELNSSNYRHTSISKEEFENCTKEPYLIHYTIVKPDKLNYFFKFKYIYKKYLESAGVKFVTKKTSIKEIFWTLTELAFFKIINLFKPKIRNKLLNFTRSEVIRIISSTKKVS
jgi:lipopolysaccharide biosynthesis glycosyltransferase